MANLCLPTLLKHKPYPFNNQLHLRLPHPTAFPNTQKFSVKNPSDQCRGRQAAEAGKVGEVTGLPIYRAARCAEVKCPTPYCNLLQAKFAAQNLFRRCSSRTPLPPGKGVPAGIHASAKNDAPRTRHSSGTFTADGPSSWKSLPTPYKLTSTMTSSTQGFLRKTWTQGRDAFPKPQGFTV